MKRISLKYVLSILAVLLLNIIVIVLLTQYTGEKVRAEDSDTGASTSIEAVSYTHLDVYKRQIQ